MKEEDMYHKITEFSLIIKKSELINRHIYSADGAILLITNLSLWLMRSELLLNRFNGFIDF